MPARWESLEETLKRKPRGRPTWDCPWAVLWACAAVWALVFAGVTSRRADRLELRILALSDSLATIPTETVQVLPAGWSEAFELQCFWVPPDDSSHYVLLRQQEEKP